MSDNAGPGARARTIFAVLLGVSGLIWMGQGVGLIPGSFMSDNPTWIYIGAGTVVIAALIGWPRKAE